MSCCERYARNYVWDKRNLKDHTCDYVSKEVVDESKEKPYDANLEVGFPKLFISNLCAEGLNWIWISVIYYGPFDAQAIFDEIPKDALEIGIYRGDHTVWCNKCQKIVMIRDCPHSNEDYLMLSGTKVREMLSKGESLPTEFARPEVAKILMNYYQSL